MEPVSDESVARFVAACHEVARRGLLRCSSGNLSWRVGPDRMLVTATRSWLERLGPSDVALCSIAEARSLNGVRPTVEAELHAGVLQARPDVDVVLHFQSPCATTLGCRASPPPSYYVIPEIPFYMGPVVHVPFLQPGSPELARAVVAAMRGHDMAVLNNHGQVTVAADFDHAIQNAVFFELACEILLRAGDGVACLTEAQATLLVRSGRAAWGGKV